MGVLGRMLCTRSCNVLSSGTSDRECLLKPWSAQHPDGGTWRAIIAARLESNGFL
jgi:hypothetical protein